jgi:Ser/Thr protein kinase RdoA (MazF antagonist)
MRTEPTKPAAQGVSAELTTSAVIVTPSECEAIACERYGLEGRAEWLWGEKDSNYRLTVHDGGEFLLKILNPAEDPDTTRMHSRALLHVERADPSIPVQRIIRTLGGDADFRLTDSGGHERSVRMVTFVPGIAQKSVPQSAAQHRTVGTLMARLQMALEDFDDPGADHRIAWDMSHAADMRALLPIFNDETRIARLTRVVDAFEALIVPALATLPTQVIHNDFNMENILLDPQDHDRVSGIIDFGDMVRAPALFDIAVGAAYQMGQADDPVGAMCAFLRGYASLKRLSEREIHLLYPAILTRMMMRVTIPEWRASLFPQQHDYYTRNSPTVWAQFARLDAIPTAEITDRLATACR